MTFNKRMLHQPLRGLDGFSARTSLQNRRKYGRYESNLIGLLVSAKRIFITT